MPLIVFARLALSLVSLAILGAAGYLLWSWHDGYWVWDAYGVGHQEHEPWRLWTALALLAWSMLGRLIVTPLLAKPDTDPTQPERGDHQMISSPTGSRLYVEMHGPADAPPVILTHGWGLDSTIWYYLRRRLSQQYRVIVWDLPGLGRSRAANGRAIDLSHFAQDLKAVLALTEGKPAVLVGHSIGGMTVQTLVRDHPQLLDGAVAGLVLVNTTYTNPLRTMVLSGAAQALRWPLLEPMFRLAIWLQPLAWLSAWQSYLSGSAHLANRIGFASQVTRSQLEHNTLLATRNPPAALARGNLAMFRWDADGALQAITVPTLILAGDSDLVTKCEASETLARATPGGRLEVISDANHMGFLERSQVYNDEIESFCQLNLVTRPGNRPREPMATET
ncbi:alpha/beta fold hydrolase [Caulobacter hibisci]|uniref:Alpha/beta hydrolase n=1 Tax=Caulobacter hibisci TaxID=2035993 RepID=A0ABS0SWZ6_9CAUL|nr:alpha/beta hydrolase [Caulobacter hibisci]MBI1684124.1 alpha/beta hydrolase [Caulobacter hibisci]